MADTNRKVAQSNMLPLPTNVADEIWTKVQQEAVLPRLSGAMPQKFGKTDIMLLSGTPKAEIVGESEAKGVSEFEVTTKQVTPIKLQTTVRTSNEFLWGDDDYRLGVFDTIKDAVAKSLVDALDAIGIHKINPKTGTVSTKINTGICDAETVVEVTPGSEDLAIDAAYKAVIANGYAPKAIAADITFESEIATARDKQGYFKYPNGTNGYLGMNGVSGTIKGTSNINAIVGDFSAFKWGVQKDIPLEVIQYGDPDGQGDLKNRNEVAIRAEVVYGVGIMDLDAFCLIEDKAAEPAKPSQGGSDNA